MDLRACTSNILYIPYSATSELPENSLEMQILLTQQMLVESGLSILVL